MVVETNCRRIGIHVKAVGRKAGDCRAHQFTAQRQHEAIVAQDLAAAGRHDGHLLFDRIDGGNLGDHMMDANRIEQPCKWNSNVAEVNLIIADTDVVIGVAVDDEDFGCGARHPKLVKLTCGADGCPQACKSRAEDKYASHPLSSSLYRPIMDRISFRKLLYSKPDGQRLASPNGEVCLGRCRGGGPTPTMTTPLRGVTPRTRGGARELLDHVANIANILAHLLSAARRRPSTRCRSGGRRPLQ